MLNKQKRKLFIIQLSLFALFGLSFHIIDLISRGSQIPNMVYTKTTSYYTFGLRHSKGPMRSMPKITTNILFFKGFKVYL